MPCCAPGANYPDYLVAVPVPIGVNNYEQHYIIDQTERLLSLFAIDAAFGEDEVQRIIPDFSCKRE